MNKPATEKTAPVVEQVEPQIEDATPELSRDQKAMAVVRSYTPWTAIAGILPLPLLDMAALMAAQLHMLSKISKIYEVPYKENTVKGIVSTLVGTLVSTGVGASLGSLIKGIPFVGPVIGFFAVPGMYSAATYAVGRVFVTHFEAGGTFLDFDAQKMRAHFIDEFEKAKAQPDLTKPA